MTKKMAGVTLLEVLLVMAIAASIIILTLRIYQQFQKDQYAIQLRYNADTLLEGLAYYYQANCAEGAGRKLSQQPFPTTFNDGGNLYIDLTNGFLPANWQPANPLIDPTAANNGYFVQFNYYSPSQRQVYACNTFWSTTPGQPGCTAPQPIPNTQVVIWVAQLAIKMRDPATTLGYLGLTGADCAVDSLPAGAPADCSQASASGQPSYLVWQRLPSLASPALQST